jgi:hypothetical protein
MEVKKLYERQPCDTNESWNAFKIYRDLGATRSIREVARILGERAENKKGLSIEKLSEHRLTPIRSWLKEHDWQNRCDAYDDDLAAMAYKSLAMTEKTRLVKTVDQLKNQLMVAAASAHNFAEISIGISTNELLKVKDASDAGDTTNSSLNKTHLDIVRAHRESMDIINTAVDWVDRAYSLTSLMDIANQQIEADAIDVSASTDR